MVWGMALPRGGGPYGPYGDYEGPVDIYGDGWGHRLKRYFSEKMPPDERAIHGNDLGEGAHWYRSFAIGKFTHECGTKDGPDRLPYTPIENHEPPRFFQCEKGYKALAAIVSLPNRVWAVSDSFKSIVELLDPAAHYFFPIEMRMPRGKSYPEMYHIVVFDRYLDSFSPTDSREGAATGNGPGRYSLYHRSKSEVTGLAFSKADFGGAHMWRERGFGEWLTCFSDELVAKLNEASLWLPKHYRMREI